MISRVFVVNQHSIDHIKGKMHLKAPMLRRTLISTSRMQFNIIRVNCLSFSASFSLSTPWMCLLVALLMV